MRSGSKVSNPTVLSSECTNLYPLIPFYISVDSENDVDQTKSRNKIPHRSEQGCNARKVNCGRVYSVYILNNFDNSHNSFLRPEYFIDFLM